jgi:hypothetical protein
MAPIHQDNDNICQACSEKCYQAFREDLDYDCNYNNYILKMDNTKLKPRFNIYTKVLIIIMSNNKHHTDIKRYVCRPCRLNTECKLFKSQENQADIYMKSAQITYLHEILMKYRHLSISKELLLDSSFGTEMRLKLINMTRGFSRDMLYAQPWSSRWKGSRYYLNEIYGVK